MSTSRPFAYNPSPNPLISGTTQVGDIAIGVNPTLDYFGGAGGVQWWQGPDEDLGYIVAKPIPPLTQPNPLNIPAGVAFGRSLFTEEAFILLAESLSSGTTFTSGNDASTWLTSNGYWNTWVFITPTPTPTLTQTPTPTPTVTETPTGTPSETPTNTPTPTSTDLSSVTTFTISGCTNLNVLVADLGPSSLAPGDVFNFTFTGGTPNGCYRIVEKTVATPTDGATPLLFYVNCAACEATLVTPTPTTTSTPTPSVTNTGTPSVTPTLTPTNTPTNTITPTNTPTPTGTPTPTPAPQYYYMSPNSWAPPSIAQSPADNFSYTNQPLSTLISTSDIDYTTTDWSFSVWGYPQFVYQTLAGGDLYSTLLSLSVPDNSMYPSGSTSLVVSVSYNNITSVNDLIVHMSDDVGAQVQWSWAINVDNNSITGINFPAMWDINNYGSTLNPQHFSNIVISHDNSLIPGNISGSTKAFWNGQLLTLKSCLSGGTYPHISNYTSLDDTRFYLSAGVPGTGWSSYHPLSINTDNPTYYPLTTLSIGNATALYAAGVVQPSIPFTTGSAYIWNFDNLPSQHLQCLDKNNGNVADFELIEVNSAGQPITYTLI